MSKLFIELYSEEIPLNIFDNINNKIEKIIKKNFENLFLNIENNCCEIYTTPCRIILNINLSFTDITINIKNELKDIILNLLRNISLELSENIKWKDEEIKWLSPLRNILCLFEEKVIDFTFCGLNSNNLTYGHKTLIGLDKNIEIKNFEDYKEKMKQNFVIFDQKIRKEIIENEILKITEKLNISINCNNVYDSNEILIKKLVNSTEFPTILLGTFKEEFLKLPNLIITNIACKNYNGFCTTNNINNFLSNNYIICSNTKITNNEINIISGYNNSINKKLNFINLKLIEFLSENLENKLNNLKSISYNNGFETLVEKVDRLINLSKFICLWTPHCDLINSEESAKLYKIDIASELVKENFYLKGYLSSYYAKINGYSYEIYKGIEESYKPRNSLDTISEMDIGKILGIADRIDDIVALFILNTKSSNLNYTYNINKNITSIIRIIIEGNVKIPINILIHKAISLFKTALYKNNNKSKLNIKQRIIDIEYDLIDLFKKRFINYMIKNACKKNLINSVLNLNIKNVKKQSINFNTLHNKILEINEYITNNREKFTIILNTHKRLNNFLKGFQIKEISSILVKIFHKRYLKNSKERILENKIKEIKKSIKNEIKSQNYAKCLDLLLEFNLILNDYLENNIVKTSNKKETNARLFLLYKIKNIFDNFLNFPLL